MIIFHRSLFLIKVLQIQRDRNRMRQIKTSVNNLRRAGRNRDSVGETDAIFVAHSANCGEMIEFL